MSQQRAIALRKASRLVQRIPLVDNEWRGDLQPGVLTPKSLLVFSRYEADVLCRSSARKPDQHHRYVWIVCLKGEGCVGIDTRIVTLHPGESMLILPFQTHFYMDISCQDIQWLFVMFEHEKSDKLDRIHSISPVPLVDDAFKYFQEFAKARANPEEDSASRLHLALVLDELSRAKRPPKPPNTSADRIPNGVLITRISKYGTDNRDRIFSISEMAEYLGLSESYLRSQFRQATGRSLGLFVRELRLSHASELLHDQTLRISEIALRCGYDSPFVFSRAFRRLFHCTPTEYRLRHKRGLEVAEVA